MARSTRTRKVAPFIAGKIHVPWPCVRGVLRGEVVRARFPIIGVAPTVAGIRPARNPAQPGYWALLNDKGEVQGGVQCRYGSPGRHLWFTERTMLARAHPEGGYSLAFRNARRDDPTIQTFYEATTPFMQVRPHPVFVIRVPAWAHRTVVEVVEVRAVRSQEVRDHAYMKGFGITPDVFDTLWSEASPDMRRQFGGRHSRPITAKAAPGHLFLWSWWLRYGKRSWFLNEWCWDVTFKLTDYKPREVA